MWNVMCSNETSKRCQACFIVGYCSRDHQREDWECHRPYCRWAKANYKLMQSLFGKPEGPPNQTGVSDLLSVIGFWVLPLPENWLLRYSIFKIQMLFKFWNRVSNKWILIGEPNLTLLTTSTFCWNNGLMICGHCSHLICHKCWYNGAFCLKIRQRLASQ